VAEEAAVSARALKNAVERLTDVGVAGIHRLLTQTDVLRAASVIIVVAGMEGALPSVVGGLVKVPVIAVPTSVGYGASFGGLAGCALGDARGCRRGGARVWLDDSLAAWAPASPWAAPARGGRGTRPAPPGLQRDCGVGGRRRGGPPKIGRAHV